MKSASLFRMAKSLITDPPGAWDDILREEHGAYGISIRYLLPLTTLVAVSAFLGSLLFSRTGVSVPYHVIEGVRCFILFSLSVYITAWVLTIVMNRLGPSTGFVDSLRLIVFSVMPLLLCQIVSRLFESFIFINILALYGLYIFWAGAGKIVNPPQNKKIIMLVAASGIFIITYMTGNWLLSKLADRIYFTVVT